jgi:hypothetical protein
MLFKWKRGCAAVENVDIDRKFSISMTKFAFCQRTKIIRLNLDTLSDDTVTNTIEIIPVNLSAANTISVNDETPKGPPWCRIG